MIIKLNYRVIAIVIAILLVGGIWFAEAAQTPQTQEASAQGAITLPVLMYHHLLKEESRNGDYVITPTQFESDLKYIREKGYTTITTSQLTEFTNNGTLLPEKPVLITFDDGYETVYSYAFPLLQKYEMNAVISIIGKHTDIFSKDDEPHHLSYSHVSWDELREMQKSGIFEIQNHTYDMHDPRGSARYGSSKKGEETSTTYREALVNDIGNLSETIEKEIGVKPTVYAYPFGEISKEAEPILVEMGFTILLTCEEKLNTIKQGQTMPIKLKRFNRAGKYTTQEFFNKVGM